MPAHVNMGIDNSYNAPLRARMEELERQQIINLQPQMIGGGRLREYALSGNNGALPVEIPRETGGAMSAGRQNTVRKQGFAKALRTYGRAVKPLGKTIAPLKHALVDAAVEGIQGGRQNNIRKEGVAKALRTFGRAVKPVGKTFKPVKQALVDAAVDEIKYGGAKVKRPPGTRAQIVKKVMEEKGLKMIEASKFVKAHGLYTKKA